MYLSKLLHIFVKVIICFCQRWTLGQLGAHTWHFGCSIQSSEINFMDGRLFASLLYNFLCRLKSFLCQIILPAIGQFDLNSNLSRNYLLFDFKAGQVVRWEGGGLVAPPLLLQRVNSWTGHTAEEAPTNIFLKISGACPIFGKRNF